MTRHRLFALPLLMFLLSAVVLAARGTGAQGEQYDLVLMGGRVLDPELWTPGATWASGTAGSRQ